MSRRLRSIWAVLTSLLIVVSGCHPQQPFYLFEDGDLSHYVGKATQIEYPDAQTTSMADVENAAPPLTIENAIPKEFWNLTLEDCVKIALDNSKVMRSLGGRYASAAQTQRAANRRSARRLDHDAGRQPQRLRSGDHGSDALHRHGIRASARSTPCWPAALPGSVTIVRRTSRKVWPPRSSIRCSWKTTPTSRRR